jgi:phage terminase large subunit-like protein
VESNRREEMVKSTLRADGIEHLQVRLVNVSRGKVRSAEPISGL